MDIRNNCGDGEIGERGLQRQWRETFLGEQNFSEGDLADGGFPVLPKAAPPPFKLRKPWILLFIKAFTIS